VRHFSRVAKSAVFEAFWGVTSIVIGARSVPAGALQSRLDARAVVHRVIDLNRPQPGFAILRPFSGGSIEPYSVL